MVRMNVYIVATPIGNLEDITVRALNVLKIVDLIFAEDSRVTQKLLNKYNIRKKVISFHKFNEDKRIRNFAQILKNVENIALVSDAGTPLVSDPGQALVNFAYEKNFNIIPVPGASSLTALLSVTPFNCNNFIFVGFVEKKLHKREKQLDMLLKQGIPFMFFDSPNRIKTTLEILCNLAPDNKILIGRELTKKFEELIFGEIRDIFLSLSQRDLKGEIAAIVDNKNANASDNDFSQDLELLKEINLSTKDIATFISKKYNVNKNRIYNLIKKGLG